MLHTSNVIRNRGIIGASKEVAALLFCHQTDAALRSARISLDKNSGKNSGRRLFGGAVFQQSFGLDLHLDPLWCAWFSGWVDGEGCFHASPNRTGSSISLALTVGLRDDDEKLIREIQRTLNCGIIYRNAGPGRKKTIANVQDMLVWRCASKSQQRHILIPLLDQYPLRSKKQRDYLIWKELVLLVFDKQHLNSQRQYCLDLCRKLSEIKKYVKP